MFNMKVIILAGGFGTRISEESYLIPKPMIEIGGHPILWHIMKIYSYYGFNEFIICAGYKQQVIKDYFTNYYLRNSDVTFDFSKRDSITIHNNVSEPWIVTVVDTQLNTMTGGRIKRIRPYVGEEACMVTYGDGVSDVDLNKLLKHHKECGRLATLTAVRPGGRFGAMDIANGIVENFIEKSAVDGGWINGGFIVMEPGLFDYIDNDETVLEKDVFEKLARDGLLAAYMHHGFWQCMDTLRDKLYLERHIEEGNAPWIKW
jgi:glucose-1-phosphate cytidylyltransferase